MNQDPRVLIVENNDVLRTLLFTILRHQPVSVDTAATTDAALRKVRDCDYALIIVDIDMPENGGERFITTFHAERPQATSFVLAVRDARNDTFLDPEHVSAILNKPIEVDILGELVRECAIAVPAPEEPLECPPSESEIRTRMERGSYIAN